MLAWCLSKSAQLMAICIYIKQWDEKQRSLQLMINKLEMTVLVNSEKKKKNLSNEIRGCIYRKSLPWWHYLLWHQKHCKLLSVPFPCSVSHSNIVSMPPYKHPFCNPALLSHMSEFHQPITSSTDFESNDFHISWGLSEVMTVFTYKTNIFFVRMRCT